MVFFAKIRNNPDNVEDILVDATAEMSNEVSSGSWTKLAETALRKRKTHEAQGQTKIPSSSVAEAKESVESTLSQIGEIVDVSSFLGPSAVAACFGVNTALNIVPAVVCVDFKEQSPNETTLNITGYSKNGKAAQNAVERFKLKLEGKELTEPLAKSNNLVWAAAFVPLISIVLDLLLGGSIFVLVGVYGFNSAIIGFDYMRLKMSGIDASVLSGGMCVLIPVYLYKRAKLLNHKLSYFITWIVFFVISLL